jgi:hypothetical protein
LDADPPKPEELWPRDPNENPPPPPRPPDPFKGLLLLSGEQPSTKGSPVWPGGQEQIAFPRPLFSQRAPGPHGLGEQGEFEPNWGESSEKGRAEASRSKDSRPISPTSCLSLSLCKYDL